MIFKCLVVMIFTAIAFFFLGMGVAEKNPVIKRHHFEFGAEGLGCMIVFLAVLIWGS